MGCGERWFLHRTTTTIAAEIPANLPSQCQIRHQPSQVVAVCILLLYCAKFDEIGMTSLVLLLLPLLLMVVLLLLPLLLILLFVVVGWW